MTKTSTKTLAAFGIVAGVVGMASALSGMADAATSGTTDITATINETLSITAASSVSGTLTNGGAIVELTTSGKTGGPSGYFNVITNHASGYTVSVKAVSSSSLSNGSTTIPYGTPTAGSSYWAIYAPTTPGGSATRLSTLSTTDQTLFTENNPTVSTGTTTTVNYKASANSSQASGTYQGKVTYTVAAQ